jgi:SAM-dependent methyltransferase
MKIWIGSPIDILYDDKANEALKHINDNKYWHNDNGIIKVDNDRWQTAQKFESDGWLKYWTAAKSDRNHEHKILFDDYKCIPNNIGNAIEIGCGPFTQLQTICENRNLNSVTLLDPLLDKYMDHEGCFYKSGKFLEYPTELLCKQAEELDIVNKFDIAICINVLEHVQDAMSVLNNLYKCLKIGGIVVFGERCYDGLDIESVYDVGHPIRVKFKVFDEWCRLFDIMHRCDINFDDPLNQTFYFIGVKK